MSSGCSVCQTFWDELSAGPVDVPGGARLVVVAKGPEEESVSRLRELAGDDLEVVQSSGTWTDYDALGRVTSIAQDSELGVLTTTTSYNSGFTTTVTNPRSKATTTSYQTFDQPSTDAPVLIVAPEGVTTTIVRDPFGKPLSTTRRPWQRGASEAVS